MKSFAISPLLFSRYLSFGVVMSFLLFCGFSTIRDIETSIIEKDFHTAKDSAEDFVAKNPASPELAKAKYYLGVSELGLGEYDSARTAFAQVMEINPSQSLYDKAWLGIIDSLGMQERFEEDLQETQNFLKQRPQSEFLSVIYLKLARANLKLSQWNRAEEYLKKILHDFPNSFEAHTARQLMKEKRFFSIQVGAFLDQSKAIKLVEELRYKGQYAYLVETQDRQGRAFYRVRVGQLKNLQEAHDMRQRLSDLGYPTHIYP